VKAEREEALAEQGLKVAREGWDLGCMDWAGWVAERAVEVAEAAHVVAPVALEALVVPKAPV
jgi:hypothetical protein